MATDFTQAGYAIAGADLPYKNDTGSTIAAGTVVKFDTSKPPSGSALGCITPVTSDVGAIGITTASIPDGASGPVRIAGAYPATNTGGVTFGDVLMGAATGVVATQTSAKRQIGIAGNTAVTGDPVLVIIHIAQNA